MKRFLGQQDKQYMSLSTGKFIFILSTERSGSTLLSAMLAGHHRVIAPAELHLMRYATIGDWRAGYPYAQASLNNLLDQIGKKNINYSQDTSTLALYKEIESHTSESVIILDKTPAYSRYENVLRSIETLLPKYVWLVRHPIGVASSRIDRIKLGRKKSNISFKRKIKYPAYLLREFYYQKIGYRIKGLAEDWMDVNKKIENFLQKKDRDRWIKLHFEDIVCDPESSIKRLCKFLGLEFSFSMLNPQKNAPKELSWGVGDEKLLAHKGISSAPAYKWKKVYKEDLLGADVISFAKKIGVKLEK